MSKNAIATKTQQQQLAKIDSFFGNINFNELNDVITKLADHNNLSDLEKTAALEIIDTWNANVIDKLYMEKEKISNFVDSLLGVRTRQGISNLIDSQMYIEELEKVIKYIGATELYDELVNTMDDYRLAENLLKNMPVQVVDLETTQAEKIIGNKDIMLERLKLEASQKRVGNAVARLNAEICRKISEDKDMQKMIRGLKKKTTDMEKLRTTAVDKAQMAKINITIDDADVRAALNDLINFKI